MKLAEIFRFELAYQGRRVSTWLTFALLFAFAFVVMAGSRPTDEDVLQNAPYGIAFATVLGGVIWLLAAASVAGEAAARDARTRMHPLTYTAPVTRAEYLGGRFLAAFVVNALILLAVPAGLLLGFHHPGADDALLGPFRPAAYLTTYGLVALPFAFVATAIQFSWAALSRRPMASYLAGILLFFASTFVSLAAARLLGRSELTGLLDLVGVLGIVVTLGDAWTAVEKNTRLVGLEGTVLASRAIWLAVAGGVLAYTGLRFRLAHPAEETRRRRTARRREARSAVPAEAGIARSAPIAVPRVRRTFGFTGHARQALGIARDAFRAIAGSRSGLVLLAATPVLVVLLVPGNLGALGAPMLPRTGFVLTFLTSSPTNPFTPWVIVPLLVILYAGELVWRERDAGLGDITGAVPVPEWAFFLGKLLGLWLVLAAWTALLVVAGVLVQLRLRYGDVEIGRYLGVLFGLQLPEYLLFALLVLAVQVVVDQKYAGLLAALVAFGAVAFAGTFGVESHLLVYGSGPAWSYSDMRGFGPSFGAWLWLTLYWAAWALLLALAAGLLWVRGREGGLGARLRAARRRLTGPTAWAFAGAAGLVLALGGFVFHNTRVLNDPGDASEALERRAEYERRYGRYAGIPQPRPAAVDLRVEIDPDRGGAEIRGVYTLVNRGPAAIDTVHVATVPEVETGRIDFDRPVALVRADDALGHRIYALRTPLQPGDSLRLGFTVRVERRGFRNDGVPPAAAAVVENGTFFTSRDWLPAVGYQADRELSVAGVRRAHGLAPRPFFRSLRDAEARRDTVGEEAVAFQAIVGTDAGQVAVAPGALRRTWTEGGRRYFHYSTDAPIGADYALFSADYAVREAEWKGPGAGRPVAIRIFHHPEHTANLDRMLRGVRASLDDYTAQFGPYPYGHLTLVERPGLGGMHAYSSLITFQEGFSLFDPEVDPRGVDIPFSVVAHEVAHQWWGSYLAPARVEGNPILSESLAQYSAYRVVEKTYGREHLRRLLLGERREEDERPRARADVPLLRAGDTFHQYRKGPWALYALSEYVGEARVNAALRRLQARHRAGELVTTLDLYRELQAVTPDAFRSLPHDLFAANTFWELATEQASARRTADGAWRVTLRVRARKVTVDPAGVETEVPMDDAVQVGVFAPGGEGDGLGQALYLRMHRVRSGTQTITVTVPRQPAQAGIDPYHLLFDVERPDNVETVAIGR